MTIDDMIEAADAYVLPCDVKVGHTTIVAGCKVGTVLRSIKNHAEARLAFGGMNERQIGAAVENLLRAASGK